MPKVGDFIMLTIRNCVVGALAAVAVAVGIAAFAALNLGGGGQINTADAHEVHSISWLIIPSGTTFEAPRPPSQGGGTYYFSVLDYNSGEPWGCEVTVPAGLILVPHGATSITVPAGHAFALDEANCTALENQGHQIPQGDSGLDLFNVGSFTIDLTADGLHRLHTELAAHEHESGVAAGVTGTGFYCGRQYYWSDIAADAEFSIFKTAARRSLIGSVYLDSDGSQIVKCVGHRLIFRPDDQ